MALGNYGGPTQTHLPLMGSVAINAALGGAPATDQRGVARPQGASADIGAVEWQASDAAYAQTLFLPLILR